MTATHNFSFVRGDSFRRTIKIIEGGVPKDITSHTIKSQARITRALTCPVSFEFRIESRIDADGQFDIVLEPIDTALLSSPHYFYDLQISTEDQTTTYMGGELAMIGDLTR